MEARLYKLLLYETGGHFVAHVDTEKEAGMFGTLIVQLPSAHEGGALTVRHGGHSECFAFDGKEKSAGGIYYSAFYADCEHELAPVTWGNRLVLVYNLVRSGPADDAADSTLSAAAGDVSRQALTECLRRWRAYPGGGPEKLLYKLEHKYTSTNLSFDGLKGQDARIGSLLQDLPGVGVALVLVTKHVRGCASVGRDYSKRRRRHSHASDDDDDDDGERAHMEDIIEQNTAPGDDWTFADGTTERAWAELDFEAELLRDDDDDDGDADVDVDFELFGDTPEEDEREFEPYMGNYGPTLEFWYHAALLVVWPKHPGAVLQTGHDVEENLILARELAREHGWLHAEPLAKLRALVELAACTDVSVFSSPRGPNDSLMLSVLRVASEVATAAAASPDSSTWPMVSAHVAALSTRVLRAMACLNVFDSTKAALVVTLLSAVAGSGVCADVIDAVVSLMCLCRHHSGLQSCMTVIRAASEPVRSRLAAFVLQTLCAKASQALARLLAGNLEQSTACANALIPLLWMPLLWGDEHALMDRRRQHAQHFIDACIASPHHEALVLFLLNQSAIKSAIASADSAAMMLVGQCRRLSILKAFLVLSRDSPEPVRSRLVAAVVQAVCARNAEVLCALLAGESEEATGCAKELVPLLWGDESQLLTDRSSLAQRFVDGCLSSPHHESLLPLLLEQPALQLAIAAGETASVTIVRKRMERLQAEGANRAPPPLDWRQPAAVFAASREVEEFLRGPQEVDHVFGFGSIARAREWCNAHVGFLRAGTNGNYRANAEARGTGRYAHCTIWKSRTAYDAEVAKIRRLTVEWRRLEALLPRAAAAPSGVIVSE